MIFDKIYKKQAQRAQTALQTIFLPFFPLHSHNSQRLASVVKYRPKLQRVYAKLKSEEKIDSE